MKTLSRYLLILFTAVSFHALGLSNQEMTQDTATESHIEAIQPQVVDSQSLLHEDTAPVTGEESASEASSAPESVNIFDVAGGCCKVCRKGKACGDSCIAANKTCHKGKGCACNASY